MNAKANIETKNPISRPFDLSVHISQLDIKGVMQPHALPCNILVAAIVTAYVKK